MIRSKPPYVGQTVWFCRDSGYPNADTNLEYTPRIYRVQILARHHRLVTPEHDVYETTEDGIPYVVGFAQLTELFTTKHAALIADLENQTRNARAAWTAKVTQIRKLKLQELALIRHLDALQGQSNILLSKKTRWRRGSGNEV